MIVTVLIWSLTLIPYLVIGYLITGIATGYAEEHTNKALVGRIILWPLFVLKWVVPRLVVAPVFIGQSIAAGFKELAK